MHIVMLVIIGLLVLAVFFFGARLMSRSKEFGVTTRTVADLFSRGMASSVSSMK
jgi:hypothetical protein